MKNKLIILLATVTLIGLIGFSLLFFTDGQKATSTTSISEESGTTTQTTTQTIEKTSIYQWSMFGHDATHTGYSNSEAPDDNTISSSYTIPTDSIKKDAEKDVRGVIYENNSLYFTFDNFVYAIDVSTGKTIWYKDLGEGTGELAIFDGKLFVEGGKELHVLNAKTGGKLWSYTTDYSITAPAITNNKIYFGSNDQQLYALNIDGTLAWKYITMGQIHSYPAVANDRVCFGSENPDFSVYCLNATTGEMLWRHTFSTTGGLGGMFHAPPLILGDRVFIGEEGGKRGIRTSGVPVTPQPSNFYALDINNGNIVWSYQASDWIVTAPAVGYDKIYFTTWDENIYAVNVSNGQLVWKSKGWSTPVVADDKVFVGSSNTLFVYNADTGNIVWSYQTKDKPMHLVIGDEKLYVGFTAEDVVSNQIIVFGK